MRTPGRWWHCVCLGALLLSLEIMVQFFQEWRNFFFMINIMLGGFLKNFRLFVRILSNHKHKSHLIYHIVPKEKYKIVNVKYIKRYLFFHFLLRKCQPTRSRRSGEWTPLPATQLPQWPAHWLTWRTLSLSPCTFSGHHKIYSKVCGALRFQ